MAWRTGTPGSRAETRAAFLRAVLTLDHADGGLPAWSPPTPRNQPPPASTSAGGDQGPSDPAGEARPS